MCLLTDVLSLLSTILLYGYTIIFFLIHSLVDGHLGCFQFLVLTNEAAIDRDRVGE